MESVVVLAVMSVVVCLLCILASCLTANKEQTVTPPSGQGADHSNVGLATTVILISAGAGWGGRWVWRRRRWWWVWRRRGLLIRDTVIFFLLLFC
ncbi:unnamed protein product [Prunus armeniaca]